MSNNSNDNYTVLLDDCQLKKLLGKTIYTPFINNCNTDLDPNEKTNPDKEDLALGIGTEVEEFPEPLDGIKELNENPLLKETGNSFQLNDADYLDINLNDENNPSPENKSSDVLPEMLAEKATSLLSEPFNHNFDGVKEQNELTENLLQKVTDDESSLSGALNAEENALIRSEPVQKNSKYTASVANVTSPENFVQIKTADAVVDPNYYSQTVTDIPESEEGFISLLLRKTKSGLDDFHDFLSLLGGCHFSILVESNDEDTSESIRKGFETTIGMGNVQWKALEKTGTPLLPVGSLRAYQNCCSQLAAVIANNSNLELTLFITIESFLIEMLPEKYYEMHCLMLRDTKHEMDHIVYTGPVMVPSACVQALKDSPDASPEGFSVSVVDKLIQIGQIKDRNEWPSSLIQVTRQELIMQAAKSLALLYKEALMQLPKDSQEEAKKTSSDNIRNSMINP